MEDLYVTFQSAGMVEEPFGLDSLEAGVASNTCKRAILSIAAE